MIKEAAAAAAVVIGLVEVAELILFLEPAAYS